MFHFYKKFKVTTVITNLRVDDLDGKGLHNYAEEL